VLTAPLPVSGDLYADPTAPQAVRGLCDVEGRLDSNVKSVPRRRYIREIPFDVAIWGDREVPPWTPEAIAEIDRIRSEPTPEWFKKLVERAKEIRAADLARH
jgi:hypothetical protein